MPLPDMSRLSIHQAPTASGPVSGSKSLWDYLIEKSVPEDKDCKNCEECKRSGFLMIKDVQNVDTKDLECESGRKPKYLHVRSDETNRRLIMLSDDTARKRIRIDFEILTWVRKHFSLICGENMNKEYFSDLLYTADLLYFDGLDRCDATEGSDSKAERAHMATNRADCSECKPRGLLVMNIFDTPEKKEINNMPSDGQFRENYAFIHLVCANKSQGFGTTLINLAVAAAAAKGCTKLALSSLVNPASFYLNKGFSFVSRSGVVINIPSRYVKYDTRTLKTEIVTNPSDPCFPPPPTSPPPYPAPPPASPPDSPPPPSLPQPSVPPPEIPPPLQPQKNKRRRDSP